MSNPLRLLRAWARCHATTSAAAVCAVATAALVLGSGHALLDIAGFRLATPLPVPLVAAITLGFGLSMASQPDAALALPDPWQVKAARTGWAASLTALGLVLITVLSTQLRDGPTASALVRNLLIGDGLGLLAVAAGLGVLGWLPPLLLFLSMLIFGIDRAGQASPWAFLPASQATTGQLITAAATCLVSAAVLATRPPMPRLTARRV
jgi:hypothetical protein